MQSFVLLASLCGCVLCSVWPYQMQCYHCEETLLDNDCSAPKFIVNCTANIQNACQKEVIVGENAGYQSFCVPGRVGSVCISCCNTPPLQRTPPPKDLPGPQPSPHQTHCAPPHHHCFHGNTALIWTLVLARLD
uniref:ly6/PLAUR domain-containing protein 1-like isoform X2 n=1 Tax=Oncorhynchus gorbuscha TaxID=8017 RepID=UPI001EAF71E8|nr:ly6/PLAUR domain-containing protein 1-like isoform X2 [Oncorhynchus gorbuscha]